MENIEELLENAKIALVLAGKDENLYLSLQPPLYAPYDSYPANPEDWPWPTTLRAAVDQLMLRSSVGTKLEIKNLSHREIGSLHFSLGGFIRNAFGLWRGNQKLCDDGFVYKELGGGKPLIDGIETVRPNVRRQILDEWQFFMHPDSVASGITEAFWWELQDYQWPELTGDFSQVRIEPQD